MFNQSAELRCRFVPSGSPIIADKSRRFDSERTAVGIGRILNGSFMNNYDSTNSQSSPNSAAPQDRGFSPWQQLKSKRISYLTLPLIVMATVVEFVILATGWKYQQLACLPQGMGVTFFSIGPIGATILAVELLKLPLAMWTASRSGLAKGVHAGDGAASDLCAYIPIG
jgi:hypothetical protein